MSGLGLDAVQVQHEALPHQVGSLLAADAARGHPPAVLHVEHRHAQVVPAALAAVRGGPAGVADVRRQADRGRHGDLGGTEN